MSKDWLKCKTEGGIGKKSMCGFQSIRKTNKKIRAVLHNWETPDGIDWGEGASLSIRPKRLENTSS